MIALWIAIVAFFLLGLNHFFPSRNAGFGLRFPFAFHTLNGWKQSQSRFYRLVMLLNILIFLYSLYIDLNEIRVLALSIISIVFSGILIFLISFKEQFDCFINDFYTHYLLFVNLQTQEYVLKRLTRLYPNQSFSMLFQQKT